MCVCVCCPAQVVQPTLIGRHGELEPARLREREGERERERGERGKGRESRDDRGERRRTERIRAESAGAHKHTGIMEKTSPLRRTLPSNGLRLLTSILTLYGLTGELALSFFSALTFRGKKLRRLSGRGVSTVIHR